MPATDWLAPEVVRALEDEYGTLVNALLYWLAQRGSGDRLRDDFGVIDRSEGFGRPDVYVPRAHDREVWVLVAEWHGFEIGDAAGEPAKTQPPRGKRSNRGRRPGAISALEANKAAAIYVEDPAGFDARDDRGAYAVHALYIKERERTAALLSRPMISHLIHAIREEWLPWDAELGRLVISGDFRTSSGMFVIPRRQPRS